MSNLDKRLREIVVGDENTAGLPIDDKAIAAIKQAFEDEGWITPENAQKTQEMVNQMANLAHDMVRMPTVHYIKPNKAMTKAQNLMSGQEWYRKLSQEMTGKVLPYSGSDTDVISTYKLVMEAAKKAASLDV